MTLKNILNDSRYEGHSFSLRQIRTLQWIRMNNHPLYTDMDMCPDGEMLGRALDFQYEQLNLARIGV